MKHSKVTPVRQWLPTVVFVALLGAVCGFPSTLLAGEGRTYKVHGTVVALTLNQTPPLIVVNTPLGPKNHMTVGAAVTAQTKILRGEKRVALQTIKEGEAVWLTYVKSTGGLLAKTIKVKG